MRIEAFHTHTEISPYKKGMCQELETFLSIWDKSRHRYIPIGFMIEGNTMYVPRAVNLQFIMQKFGINALPGTPEYPTINYNFDDYVKIPAKYKMLATPKDRIQEEACDFMMSEGSFSKEYSGAQYMLNLDTGLGKTFTMIYTIMKFRLKSLVIVNREHLATQWVKEILSMTNLPSDRVKFIDSSAIMEEATKHRDGGYIYVITHQRIESYASTNGWNAVREWFQDCMFGIKCYDEAHRYFENILHVDFFSNTYKTYYLTATFGRATPGEERLYNIVFRSAYRFGEQVSDYEEIRKHIIFVPIMIRSDPPPMTNVKTGHGFSNYKYIDYALNEEGNTLLRAYSRIIDQIRHLEGKILVISPKIESTEIIAEYTRKHCGKSCYAVHSKNDEEENDRALSSEVISTTFGSIGEGLNIKKLRCVIVAQGIGNKINMSQLRGRLREYDSEHDTFLFYIVDTAFTELTDIYRRAVLPVMKRKAKEINIIQWYDI